MSGGDFTDTLTFWVTLSTIPLWAIAIVLKRINARRREAAKKSDPLDCFFLVQPEHAADPSDDLPLRFRKWDGQ